MMSKILLVIGCLLLMGCGEPMSRQEVITAMKECDDGGMKGLITVNGLTYQQVRVICVPIEELRKEG